MFGRGKLRFLQNFVENLEDVYISRYWKEAEVHELKFAWLVMTLCSILCSIIVSKNAVTLSLPAIAL